MKLANRFIQASSVTVVSVLALAACSANPTTATDGGDNVAPVGFSAIALQDPAMAAMQKAFESDATKRNLTALPARSADFDATVQDNDIRTLVSAGAKSIILIPSDPSALVPAVEAARDQGVFVATMFQGTIGGKVDISMSVDNYAMGVTACQYLAKKIGGNGTLLHVQGDLRTSNAQQRDAGFTDCLKKHYPGITAISKTGGQWDPVTAAASVSAVLVSNPELGGIFTASEGYVESVYQTLQSAGRTAKAGEDGHIWTMSIDGTPDGLDAIREGRLDATLTQPITDLVAYGLDYLEILASGGKIKIGPTDHDSVVRKSADGYPEDVFTSTVVTIDNVDDQSLWGNNA